MADYYGDFPEDATVKIPFNTFDSNDPSASVTITNLADADIKVSKDGAATPITTDGATIVINLNSIVGVHIITIDTSVDAAYSTGSEYQVRIEGTTVDGATIDAWVGSFSIERAGGALALIKLIPTTAMRGTDNALLAASINLTGGAVDVVTTLTNLPSIPANWLTAAGINAGALSQSKFGSSFIQSTSFATGAINAAALASNAITAVKINAGALDGKGDWNINKSGYSLTVAPLTAVEVRAEADAAIAVTTYAEPSSVPSATTTIANKIGWVTALARNKGLQTNVLKTLRNDADNGDIATSVISSDGTTFTRNEYI